VELAELKLRVNRLRRLKKRPQELLARPSFAAWSSQHLCCRTKTDLRPLTPESGLHCWFVSELETLHERRGKRMALVAPRASAKTTWASYAYPLYCGVHGLEPYIFLISDTQAQARINLANIREEIEDQFPELVGSPWGQDRMRLANGVVVEALGTGSKIRGRRNRVNRPTLIVVDDPENDEHITSVFQRDRSWNWFNRAVANAGTSQTNVLVLGTALHRDCLVLRLSRTAGWDCMTFRAVGSWPTRLDLWKEWELIYQDYEDDQREEKAEEFYRLNKQQMDAGAELLWPEAEPLLDLMKLRATIGWAAFSSEKQGNPVNPEACEWPVEYFGGPGFWFERWPEHIQIKTVALDPSKGKDAQTGDYSAFVKLGRDRAGVLYVEADLQRRPAPQIVDDGVEMIREFRPDGFAIETNQFQELFCVDFERVGQEQGVFLPIYGLNNQVNKQVRIRRLGPYLAQRKMRFKSRSPGTALLVEQMKDFPVGDHDDGPDALEMALRLSIELWNEGAVPRR